MFALETFQIGSDIQLFSVGTHITSHGFVKNSLGKLWSLTNLRCLSDWRSFSLYDKEKMIFDLFVYFRLLITKPKSNLYCNCKDSGLSSFSLPLYLVKLKV